MYIYIYTLSLYMANMLEIFIIFASSEKMSILPFKYVAFSFPTRFGFLQPNQPTPQPGYHPVARHHPPPRSRKMPTGAVKGRSLGTLVAGEVRGHPKKWWFI